jgi:ABC-type sulfate/molybdate transport systems ATPase subunit
VGAVVSLRGVRHRRGGRDVLAIEQLDLGAGERLAVLGPNGAGKTTLLRLLAGLEGPTTGVVAVNGEPIAGADLALRRRVGYATQRPGLLATSVSRNVELPLRWRGVDPGSRRAAALAALARLNVVALAERKALSLSGGEAQRVSLARALAIEPELLLLDEPAAGLDAEARRAFFDDLERALGDRATTVVHVTHRAEEALRLADSVAVLAEGAIRQIDDPPSVVRQPADATVARLVGYENVLPVEIDGSGQVLIGGAPCGVETDARRGPATLAAWATAVHVVSPDSGPLRATVERVSQGPGRWEIALTGSQTLQAHLPFDHLPPARGHLVGVRFDRTLSVVIPQQG